MSASGASVTSSQVQQTPSFTSVVPPRDKESVLKEKTTRIACAAILALIVIGSGVAIGLLCHPPIAGITIGSTLGVIGLTSFIIYAVKKDKTAKAAIAMIDAATSEETKKAIRNDVKTCYATLLQVIYTRKNVYKLEIKDLPEIIKGYLSTGTPGQINASTACFFRQYLLRPCSGYPQAINEINQEIEQIVRSSITTSPGKVWDGCRLPGIAGKEVPSVIKFSIDKLVSENLTIHIGSHIDALNASAKSREKACQKIISEYIGEVYNEIASQYETDYLKSYGEEKLKSEITSELNKIIPEEIMYSGGKAIIHWGVSYGKLKTQHGLLKK